VEFLKIVGTALLAAILYGIIHDQLTARVCVEYFTIGHPPVFDTNSPTILALGWGVIATWWVGLPLGLGLAVAARAGNRRKRDVRSLLLPIFGLLAIMGCCAVVAGVLGSVLAAHWIAMKAAWSDGDWTVMFMFDAITLGWTELDGLTRP
jgi:hypothetical protein